MDSPLAWLLNTDSKKEQVVDAPAFSLTKVLTIGAPVDTGLVSLISDKQNWFSGEMRPVHYTVLVVAVLGLIAIAGSADVIARGIATAATRAPTKVVSFAEPIAASRFLEGADAQVKVVAYSMEEPPRYLCVNNDGTELRWETEASLAIGNLVG
jgi:hypothetical protein